MGAFKASRQQRVRASWGAPQLTFTDHSHTPPPQEGSLTFQPILCLEPTEADFSGAGYSSKPLAERTCLLATLDVGWDRV